MSDRRKVIARLLRENNFALVRDSRHLVYVSPQFDTPFVMACTASDYRASENNLSDLKRIISGRAADSSNRRPTSTVVMTQRIKQAIRALPAPRRGAASVGTGIAYIKRVVRELTPEQKAQSVAASNAEKAKAALLRHRRQLRNRLWRGCWASVLAEIEPVVDKQLADGRALALQRHHTLVDGFDTFWEAFASTPSVSSAILAIGKLPEIGDSGEFFIEAIRRTDVCSCLKHRDEMLRHKDAVRNKFEGALVEWLAEHDQKGRTIKSRLLEQTERDAKTFVDNILRHAERFPEHLPTSVGHVFDATEKELDELARAIERGAERWYETARALIVDAFPRRDAEAL